MFTIYSYNVGGRNRDRYYHLWREAAKALKKEVDHLVNESGWKIIRKISRMNNSKGIYEYQFELVTPEGETAILSLKDGFFEDED